MNLFFVVWLTGWGFFCGMLIHGYFNAGKMNKGDPVPLWFVVTFVLPWFFVASVFLYLKFSRKTFRLASDAMHMQTRLFTLTWNLTLPRDTIARVEQVKDGGEGDDSFPSWGLKIKTGDPQKSTPTRFSFLNGGRKKLRSRSILYRLPYDHSAWLGKIIAEWAGAALELCPNPDDTAESRLE